MLKELSIDIVPAMLPFIAVMTRQLFWLGVIEPGWMVADEPLPLLVCWSSGPLDFAPDHACAARKAKILVALAVKVWDALVDGALQ